MSLVAERKIRPDAAGGVATAPPSPAGPAPAGEPVRMPPALGMPPWVQTVRFGARPIGFNLSAQRRFGDVWQKRILTSVGKRHMRQLVARLGAEDVLSSLAGQIESAAPWAQCHPRL